jgi:hypothetical protein
MTVHCPSCHRTDVRRIPRCSLWDMMFLWVRRWPWFCRACQRTFHSTHRALPPPKPERTDAPLQYRRLHVEPAAAVVLRAPTQHQLDSILLALHEAVRREQELNVDEPAFGSARR